MPTPACERRAAPPQVPPEGSRGGPRLQILEESKEELEQFLKRSVTEGTAKSYKRSWELWCKFLSEDVKQTDPYLEDMREDDKAPLMALFLGRRFGKGMRGKEATGVTAGIRHTFMTALASMAFLDSSLLTQARTACRMSTAELRAKKDIGPTGSTKLPLCLSMLAEQRSELWTNKSWSYPDIDSRSLYAATQYAFDMGARPCEYTASSPGAEDHCVRAGDCLFEFETETGSVLVKGGDVYFHKVKDGSGQSYPILGCWVKSSTHKVGTVVKTKLIGRRGPEEAQFLDDLVEWVTQSGVGPKDELFTRYTMVNGVISPRRFWPKAVRANIKDICERAGLDPKFFSAHSLRKASMTHMRAMGASVEDRRERGNYSDNSQVLNTTYDYSTAGHGALSSSSIGGGVAVGVEDIRRYIPASQGNPSVGLGGGVPR